MSHLKFDDPKLIVDGKPVPTQLKGYYANYAAMADPLSAHPEDIQGAYEQIWDKRRRRPCVYR